MSNLKARRIVRVKNMRMICKCYVTESHEKEFGFVIQDVSESGCRWSLFVTLRLKPTARFDRKLTNYSAEGT